MPEEKQLYMATEFFGYMIQILPILFLFFLPYRQEHLRADKRKLLAGLTIVTTAVSAGAVGFLGSIYNTPAYDMARTYGNMIFGGYLLLGTVLYWICVKKTAGSRMLTYMLVFQYGILIYVIAEIGVKFPGYSYKILRFTPYSGAGVMIYLGATLLTWPFVYRFLKRFGTKHFQKVDRRSIRLISVSSFIIFVLCICVLQAEMLIYGLHKDLTTSICLIVWMICLILTDLLAYFIYFRCLRIEEEKVEMNLRLVTEEMQFQALQDKIQEDKRMYHNMRHHFRTLAALTEGERYQELKEYLQKYLKEWEELSQRDISRNPMINTILGYYFSLAQEKEISLKTDIYVKEHYPFSITDMTVLLGNAMENALEACGREGVEEPFINLKIKQYKAALLIQIENRCPESGYPVMEEGKTPSTKRGRNHGYGISSMGAIAEKYQGSLEFWKKGSVFTLRIVLNIPEEPELQADRKKDGYGGE